MCSWLRLCRGELDLALVPTATRALLFASRKSVQMASRNQLMLHYGLNILARNNDCCERFVLSSVSSAPITIPVVSR
jgi:hypothetical protein